MKGEVKKRGEEARLLLQLLSSSSCCMQVTPAHLQEDRGVTSAGQTLVLEPGRLQLTVRKFN